MIVAISGNPGSGKSTVAKRVADALGYKRYDIGSLRREMAKKRGLTLEEYNELGEQDPQTDVEVDEYQRELGTKEDDFVIEGRTSFYFIPHALKIFIDISPEEGARRVLADLSNGADRNEADLEHHTVKEIMELNAKRMKSDDHRYRKYYNNLDIFDRAHYDAWIDTTALSKDDVFTAVMRVIQEKES